jgi:HEAT repeat protein
LLLVVVGEDSAKVLGSIGFACGHLHEPGCIEALLHLKQHRDADVRYAIVHALSGHEDGRAIQALIELSSDDDKDIRNWATFGIGSQIETDTAEIKNALFSRLQEEDAEIRGEALVGLARRQDERVVAPLLKELESESPDVLRDWVLMSDAIESVVRVSQQTGNRLWLPILERAKAIGIGEALQIQAAMDCCTRTHE